jgi:hypothetical protein
MNIISFDVGIKNMAYCILNTNNGLCIQDWSILNLLDPIEENVLCSCQKTLKKPKKNKPLENIVIQMCKTKAKYEKNGKHYCDKHAKANTEFIVPTKECSPVFLKKLKLENLQTIALTKNINCTDKKPVILAKVLQYYEQRCYNLVHNKKSVANDADLISIGINLKRLLNQIQGIENLTHVIIENQFSTVASRMKTIQGMLAQYFIMINDNIHIEFISSSNKLKGYEKFLTAPIVGESSEKDKYKLRKNNGILCCSQLLKENPELYDQTVFAESSKKDDLSDCFLQGIWYLRHQNIISCAENLKINSV